MTDDDKALVERLRDGESYYSWQEKHWCIDFDLLERLHLEAADRIEAQAAEIERLKRALWKIEFEVQQAFAPDEPLTGQAGSEA
jgi:hypothetical protein